MLLLNCEGEYSRLYARDQRSGVETVQITCRQHKYVCFSRITEYGSNQYVEEIEGIYIQMSIQTCIICVSYEIKWN